jgi:hypothetical protein
VCAVYWVYGSTDLWKLGSGWERWEDPAVSHDPCPPVYESLIGWPNQEQRRSVGRLISSPDPSRCAGKKHFSSSSEFVTVLSDVRIRFWYFSLSVDVSALDEVATYDIAICFFNCFSLISHVYISLNPSNMLCGLTSYVLMHTALMSIHVFLFFQPVIILCSPANVLEAIRSLRIQHLSARMPKYRRSYMQWKRAATSLHSCIWIYPRHFGCFAYLNKAGGHLDIDSENTYGAKGEMAMHLISSFEYIVSIKSYMVVLKD